MGDLYKQAKLLETLANDQAGTIPPKVLADYLLILAARIEHNEGQIDKLIGLTETLIGLMKKQ